MIFLRIRLEYTRLKCLLNYSINYALFFMVILKNFLLLIPEGSESFLQHILYNLPIHLLYPQYWNGLLAKKEL